MRAPATHSTSASRLKQAFVRANLDADLMPLLALKELQLRASGLC